MKKATTVRFDDDLKAALQEIADKRETHVSAVVNLACAQFVANEGMREEFAALEASFAASFAALTRETLRISDDQQLIIAWLDQLTKFQFQAMPEVVDKKAAAVVGARRYSKFISSFKDSMEGSRRRASVLTRALGEDEDPADPPDGAGEGESGV